MLPSYFRPALSPEEEQAYQAQTERKTEQIQGNIAVWQRWLRMREAHNADVPLVLPSQCTPLFGLASEVTGKNEQVPVDKQDTQKLRAVQPAPRQTVVYHSIRREIWSQLDTKPEMPAIRPMHTTLKAKKRA
jgi:hypothetical protein